MKFQLLIRIKSCIQGRIAAMKNSNSQYQEALEEVLKSKLQFDGKRYRNDNISYETRVDDDDKTNFLNFFGLVEFEKLSPTLSGSQA